MKTKVLITIVMALMLFACGAQQIEGTPNNQVIAYLAGKGVGITINTLAPKADEPLTKSYKDMMEKNKGNEIVPAQDVMNFYNNCIMDILPLFYNDPYGLVGDLSMLLKIYGAQLSPSGAMVMAQDIPYVVLETFGQGYRNGQIVAQNLEKKKE